MNRKTLGNDGENYVVQLLQQRGFIIHTQNYRKFFGEIDIIAYKQQLYIFVEVKTRKSDCIPLTQLISPSKQQKIIKTAQTFIAQEKISYATCRFDVALLKQHNDTFDMQYIENAFTQQDTGYYGY